VDQYYFEEGYTEARYFGYIAQAQSGFTPYIAEGYLPTDFFEDRGAFASIFCDAEIKQGMLLEAQAYISSMATFEATVYKLTETTAALNCEFTQTAIGTRGKDIDLFAFSNAAIAVAVSRIRDNNIAASAVFSVAIDFVVERSADADVDAVFSAIINGLRSRDTITQTQAAFSFGLTPDLFKTFDSSLSAEASVSVSVKITRTVGATVSSEATASTDGSRIRFGISDIASEFAVNATVRKIRDAHLTGTGVAAISCDAVKSVEASSTQSAEFTQTALAGTLEVVSANLPVYASVFVSRRIADLRPRNLPVTVSGSTYYDATNKKFGSHSLHGASQLNFDKQVGGVSGSPNNIRIANGESFVLEAYVRLGPNNSCRLDVRIAGIQIGIQTNGEKGSAGIINSDGNFVFLQESFNTISYNIFNHLLVVSNGTTASWYFNGSRRFTTTSLPSAYFTSGVLLSGNVDYWLDELSFHKGTTLGYNPSSTTISVPSSARTNGINTQGLWHFDNNALDDYPFVGETFTGNSEISSTASLTAAIGYVATYRATISASSSVTAVIGKLNEINLVALDDAELSADADVTRSAVSSITSEVSVSTNAERIRDTGSSQSSEFSQTTQPYRVRFNTINTNAEFSQSASAVKTVVVAGSLSAQVSVTAVIGTLEDINLVAFSDAAVTTTAVKTTDTGSSISGVFAQQSAINVIASFESAITSENSLTAINNRLRDVTVSLSTEASTLTVANEFEGATANLSSRFFTAHIYIDDEYLESGYYNEFETPVAKIAAGAAAFAVSSALTASIRTDVFVAMVVNSSAAVVATVVKTAFVTASKASQSTLTATVRKITDVVSTPSFVFAVFCNGVTSSEVNLVAFSNASVSATLVGTKPGNASLSVQTTFYANTQDSLNKVGSANISSQFSTTTVANFKASAFVTTESIASSLSVVVKSVVVAIPLDSNFTVSADVSRFRATNITASASATVNATAVKTTDVDSQVTSAFAQTAVARKTVNAQIITEAVASNLTAVVRLAGLFIDCTVAATVVSAVVVKRGAASAVTAQSQIAVTPTKIVRAQSAINGVVSVSGIIGVRKQFASAVSSALSFVVAIRDLRIDEVVYVIPGENWSYVIVSESRIHEIYGETRIRSITGETRERTIDGESRIHILE